MDANPSDWIVALGRSHERLRSVVEPLDGDGLRGPSYASEWSIAQVLSHLGSGAELFTLFLDAGLRRAGPPGREVMEPIWAEWNAKSAEAQASEALVSDAALIERIRSLDAKQREEFRLAMFGMDLDLVGLVRMRLGEHAVHTWDIAVAIDPTATIAPDAVALLVDALGPLVARSGKPTGAAQRIGVQTSEPSRRLTLEVGDPVSLTPAEHGDVPADVRLPAEALIRLVYGRLDPAHTPPEATTHVDLAFLRSIFPGF